ncbi:MAG TPA: PepSY domain-containing protein [Terriglobia bacterium]|nr:PepSY domain-containing protein [Terriglobia bacterium]
MIRPRKSLILAHRYLGIVLSLMFVMWFVTGIGMIYSRGMPRLTPQVRLSRLSPLDLAQVRLSPSEAVEHAELDPPGGRVTLLTVNERPAYRFGNSATVFADNGEFMDEVDFAAAIRIAGRFMNVPEERVHYAGQLTRPDQWTLTQTRQLPLYKVTVDDAARTELYVSAPLAEVVQVTTRGSRILSWVSTIPHFLYFAPLRLTDGLWVKAMTWTSGLACVLALLGIALGVVQYRRKRPHIPYSGWMRWHYLTGLVFGVLTLTWAFSGLLSLEPWAWTEKDTVERQVRQAFTGGPLDLASFPAMDSTAWGRILEGRPAREIEFARIFDESYYIVRTSPEDQSLVGWPDGGHQPYFVSRDPDAARFVVAANSLKVNQTSFDTEVIVNRLKQANPGAPVIESAVLTEYDSYYYSRDRQAPLPVVRVKLGDSDKTWVYVDPGVGQVVGQVNRFNRVERWLYNGLHTLDFSFLYYNRPLWDSVVILLSLGGTAVSGIGLFMGLKRIRRGISASTRGM